MTKKIAYFIGTHPYGRGKPSPIYLWRNEGNQAVCIAKFMNHTAVETFSKEMGFPLSDKVQKIVDTVWVSGQSEDE